MLLLRRGSCCCEFRKEGISVPDGIRFSVLLMMRRKSCADEELRTNKNRYDKNFRSEMIVGQEKKAVRIGVEVLSSLVSN